MSKLKSVHKCKPTFGNGCHFDGHLDYRSSDKKYLNLDKRLIKVFSNEIWNK